MLFGLQTKTTTTRTKQHFHTVHCIMFYNVQHRGKGKYIRLVWDIVLLFNVYSTSFFGLSHIILLLVESLLCTSFLNLTTSCAVHFVPKAIVNTECTKYHEMYVLAQKNGIYVTAERKLRLESPFSKHKPNIKK